MSNLFCRRWYLLQCRQIAGKGVLMIAERRYRARRLPWLAVKAWRSCAAG
nr:hypothetical protein [Paracoccus saliphilus]